MDFFGVFITGVVIGYFIGDSVAWKQAKGVFDKHRRRLRNARRGW